MRKNSEGGGKKRDRKVLIKIIAFSESKPRVGLSK